MRVRSSILSLGSTVLVWALLGLSVVYWGLVLTQPAPPAVPPAAPVVPQIKSAAIAAWLGAAPEGAQALAPAQRRYELRGVIAQGNSGVAVLSVDGQPARPYRVGSSIEDGLMLRSVGQRHAELAADARGPVLQRLELPAPDTVLPEGIALVPARR